MKRIFLFLLLSISIFSFSQSEIWGIKQQAGKNNGGFLYGIDSSTNKIIEHQYFANPKTLNNKSEIFYDSTLKCMFGVSNQILYKYDLVSRTTESKILVEEVFGSLFKASNGYLYILARKALLKINPTDMSMEKVGQLYGQFLLPDSTMLFDAEIGTSFGLSQVSEDHFVISNYTFDNAYYWHHSFIYSINTITDSIELIYRTSMYPEDESLIPLGSFYPYNGLLYAMYSMNGEIALYSLHAQTNEFIKIRTFDELSIFQNSLPYFISDNGSVYGKTANSSGNKTLLYEYNIDSEQFQILAETSSGNSRFNRMIIDGINGLYLLLDSTEDYYIKTAFYKYDFETNQLDSLYYIKSKYYNDYKYNEFGPLVSFDNGFISFLDSKEDLDNYIVSYNIEQHRIDTIAHLQNSLNFTDSLTIPASICETQNGNILLLNNRELRLPSWEYKFFFSFTEFNPQTKELYRADELELASYCRNPRIYHMNDDDFCISCSQNNIIIKYNWQLNEMTYVQTPFSGIWLKDKGNSFINITDNSGVYKFHFDTEQFVELYKPNIDTSFDKGCLYHEDQLIIYSESIEQFLIFDLNSNEMNSISELSKIQDHIDNFRVEKLFSEGDYVFIIVTDLSPYTKKLFRYHIPSHELKLINTEENDNLPYYQFIENYTNNGVFITSIDSDNNSSGDLKSLLHISDSSIILDGFENKTNDYENINDTPSYLFKAKKKPIHRWIGELSNDWYDAENWSSGVLPNDSSSVNIMNDALYYPIIDTSIKMKNLYIYNDARMTINLQAQVQISGDFKNHGQLKMLANSKEKSSLIIKGVFIQKGTQSYTFSADSIKCLSFSSPMQVVEKYVQPFYTEAVYHPQDSIFDNILFYPFLAEKSEAYQYTSDDTLVEFKGSFNNGPESLQIQYLQDAGLYPLPNPYPSSISWSLTDLNSLTHSACYFYNEEDSSFSATIDGIGNHPPLIRPLEVFWVYSDGLESIQIDPSALMHEKDYKEEIPDRKVLSLEVLGTKKVDETLISFNDQAINDFDPKYDALKFIKNKKSPQIFTKAEEELLMINQLPDTSMMNLFVQNGENGTMKIRLGQNHGFEYLVLEDLVWNTRTDLLESDYSFDYFTSDGHYPFKLYFTPWVLEPIEEADIQMYYYPEFLVVKSRKQIKYAEITFYDLAGREALKFSEQNIYYLETPIQIPAGHYIVQLRSGDLVVNEKVLVR